MRFAHCAVVISLIVTLTAGCTTVTSDYQNGQRESEGATELLGSDQVGEWTYWHTNGQMKARGAFEKDRQVGQWHYWYDNGNTEMVGAFHEQRRHGPWSYSYRNGQLRARGHFDGGRETGRWEFYDENSTLTRSGEYLDGKQTLRWISRHPNGTKRAEGFYFSGQRVGLWREWDDSGVETTSRYPFPEDVELVRELWPSGEPRRQGFLEGGARVGRWITYHSNGQRRFSGDFVKDQPQGRWRAFADTGELMATGVIADGRPTGAWTDAEGTSLWVADTLRPAAPFHGDWSASSISDSISADQVVEQWLAEVTSSYDADNVLSNQVQPRGTPSPAVVNAADDTNSAAAIADRPAVPVGPQPWTVRERKNLDRYRKNYGMNPPPPAERETGRYGERVKSSDKEQQGDTSKSDPLVGRPFPVARFVTADGSEIELSDLAGKPVLIVVLRGYGGQVCIYCVAQTEALEEAKADFAETGTEVLVVYPGPASSLDGFLKAYEITFKNEPKPSYRLVYDADLRMVEALGIERDLAIPTSILLDENGRICDCYVGRNIADRPPAKYWIDKIKARGGHEAP